MGIPQILSESEKAASYDKIMAILQEKPPASMPGEIFDDLRYSSDMLGASLYILSSITQCEVSPGLSRYKAFALSFVHDVAAQNLEDILCNLSCLSAFYPRAFVSSDGRG